HPVPSCSAGYRKGEEWTQRASRTHCRTSRCRLCTLSRSEFRQGSQEKYGLVTTCYPVGDSIDTVQRCYDYCSSESAGWLRLSFITHYLRLSHPFDSAHGRLLRSWHGWDLSSLPRPLITIPVHPSILNGLAVAR